MLAGERQHRVYPSPAILEIDRVDDGASRVDLQRCLNDPRFGRIDHKRRFDAHLQLLDGQPHLFGLVTPLGQRHLHIQHVGATVHLIPSHLEQGIVVVGQERLLHLAATLRIHSLADEKRRGILLQRVGPHRRSHEQSAALAHRWIKDLDPLDRTLSPARVQSGQLGGEGLNMLGRSPAAAADDIDPEVTDELAKRLRHRLGLHRVDRLTADIERQTGIRNRGDGERQALGKVPDRLPHVLGPGRTIEAGDVDAKVGEDCRRGGDVSAQKHAPAGIQSHLRLNG